MSNLIDAFDLSLGVQIGIAVVGAVCFAIVFRTPKKYFALTVLVGTFSCLVPRYLPTGWNVGFSTFVVAVATAVISHIFARITSAPAQCFLIPGVIFLVPGTYIYRAFSAALQENNAESFRLVLAAVTITCGISFGILVANWLVPSRKTL